MNTHYNFSDQCGIITGPASGIGKSLATLLAKSGAGLTLVDRGRPGLETITRVCKEASSTLSGFYAAEIKSKGSRIGFELRGFEGEASLGVTYIV